MDQKNQGSGSGSGSPSNVPAKRKRGRPRKYETVVHGENKSGNETTDHSMVDSMLENLETTDHSKVGNLVNGVVEGIFGAGYLVNVKVLGEPDSMRGLVFKPGQVIPVTPQNDVAPHLKMIKRKDIPIPPLLNKQTGVHGFVPPIPPLLNRQIPIPVLPNTQTEVHGSRPSLVPVSEEHLLPTEINSGISVSVEKDLPKNETSIIMSKLESDKAVKLDTSTKVKESTSDEGVTRDSRPASPTIEDTDKELRTEHQGDTLHELDVDASTKVKESAADGDGEATREYSRPASDIISLVQTTENTNKELITEQQAMPSVHQLDQMVHEEPNSLNIVIPASGGPESKQSEDSEEISKSVDNIEEKQDSPKTDLLDTKTETDLPIVSDK